MKAMLLEQPGAPLRAMIVSDPEPRSGQVLVKVAACGVCRTDLHISDGELNEPRLPIILGHEIVGHVEAVAPDVRHFRVGDRVGVPWLGHLRLLLLLHDGTRKPLRCAEVSRATRSMAVTPSMPWRRPAIASRCRSATPTPPRGATPMRRTDRLSRAAHGWRRMHHRHLWVRSRGAHRRAVAQFEQRAVYAFTRLGDTEAQAFARSLGCVGADGSDEPSRSRSRLSSFSRPSAGSCRQPFAACAREARWCSAAFT